VFLKRHIDDLRSQQAFLKKNGVECHVLNSRKCQELYPPIENHESVAAGLYVPDDGVVDPTDACMRNVEKAKANGAIFFENCPVIGFRTRNQNQVSHVITEQGDIEAKHVILTAGPFARELAQQHLGLHIPIGLVPHQYVVLKTQNKFTLPIFRDLENGVYIRPHLGGILSVGRFGADPPPIQQSPEISLNLLPNNDEDIEKSLFALAQLMPSLINNAGVRHVICAADAFSVQNILLGIVSPFANLSVGAGFNSQGIMQSEVGRIIARVVLRQLAGENDPNKIIPPEFKINNIPIEVAQNSEECERLARLNYAGAYSQDGEVRDEREYPRP